MSIRGCAFILSLTFPFISVRSFLFRSCQFRIVLFLLSFGRVASAASHGNDTSADSTTATPSDTGYRVRKVHKHISSCTFSTIKWQVHYDFSSLTLLRCCCFLVSSKFQSKRYGFCASIFLFPVHFLIF